MKKLLTNFLLAVLLNVLIFAAPGNCNSLIKVSTITRMDVGSGNAVQAEKKTEFEIHPLDILALKFN